MLSVPLDTGLCLWRRHAVSLASIVNAAHILVHELIHSVSLIIDSTGKRALYVFQLLVKCLVYILR